MDEMDKMADARCSRPEMRPDAGGCRRILADGIDKMRDARWRRADEKESAD